MDDWTREVCELRAMGYSLKEIACRLRERTNRVNVRLSRGLDKARKLLNP